MTVDADIEGIRDATQGRPPTLGERIRSLKARRSAASRAQKLRVLHCIGSLGAGGAERQLCNLVVGSARRGWETRVVTASEMFEQNAYYLPLLARAGVSARHASSSFHPALREVILSSREHAAPIGQLPEFLLPHTLDFLAEMLSDPPDIVHSWLDLTNIWSGVAALFANVPVIVLSLRNLSPWRFPYLYHDWFKPWYQLLAANPRVHFINNSTAGARDYADWLGLPIARIQVVTNGVDFESIPTPPPATVSGLRATLVPATGLLLLGVFRLSEEKRPLLFFEVARRMLEEFRGLTVLLVGTGPLRQQLEEAIAESGLGQRFKILPHREDLPTLMAAADLMLLTSRYEGTPNVVLEAQRMGCPVVATRAGGTVDAIDDHRTGLLVDLDDTQELVAAVRSLLVNEDLRHRLGAAGPEFVARNFGLERMVDETLEAYCQQWGLRVAESDQENGDDTAVTVCASNDSPHERRLTRRIYKRLREHPRLGAAANRLRQWKWLHGETRVPLNLKRMVRDQEPICGEVFPATRRVTHYIGSLGPGGSERQLCNLVSRSAARGLSVRVLTAVEPTGNDGYYVDLLLAAGVVPIKAGASFHKRVQWAVANLPILKLIEPIPGILRPHMLNVLGEIMTDPPHILHTWLDLTNIWASIAGLLAGVPAIVVSTRSVNPTNFPAISNPWFRDWYRLLTLSPRVHFINNSKAGAQDYAQWLGVPASRFRVIRNGVDLSSVVRPDAEALRTLRSELGIGADAKVVLGVFRLSEEKQPLLFQEACLKVLSRVPDAHVILVGSGAFENQLAETVARLRIGARFHLLGQRRDVHAIMAASDLLLLTSRLEGTPNVLLEAQWMGCPVVTTAAGGAVDALVPGKTGEIVAGNVQAISNAVIDLLYDDARRGAMAQAAPRFVAEHFGVERMVDETLALYTHCLA